MPTLDEIYDVPVRTPVRMNLDAYAQALNKIDQRDLAAREEVSKINAGLANIKANLNVADYDWFDEFTNNINNQINKEASFGSLANALNKATELGSTYGQDSELLARLKANQDYEKFKSRVENAYANKQISKLRMQRILDENKYKFNAIYDENGNFLTYDSTNYNDPVRNVDLSDMIQKAGNMVHEKVEQFLLTNQDSNNIITTETILSKTKEAIKQTFDEIYANNPDAILALQSDYDDLVYQIGLWEKEQNNYNKDSSEYKDLQNKIDQAFEQISDDGIIPENKYENYLFKRTGNTIKNMSYITSKTALRTLGKGNKNPGGTTPQEYLSSIPGAQVVIEDQPVNYTDYSINLTKFNLLGDELEQAFSDEDSNIPPYARNYNSLIK